MEEEGRALAPWAEHCLVLRAGIPIMAAKKTSMLIPAVSIGAGRGWVAPFKADMMGMPLRPSVSLFGGARGGWRRGPVTIICCVGQLKQYLHLLACACPMKALFQSVRWVNFCHWDVM